MRIRLGDDNQGKFKDLSVIDGLHKITAPTLVINGVDDEIQDSCVDPFFYHIRKVKRVKFLCSSHLPYYEERAKYMRVVGEFLLNVGN